MSSDLAYLFDVAANVDQRLTDEHAPWYQNYFRARLPVARGLLENRLWDETERIENGQLNSLSDGHGTVWSYEDGPSNPQNSDGSQRYF